MAINDVLIYEVNEQGESVLVQSIESTQRAFIRFRNMTSRPVDVWWRDFQGHKQHYVCLAPKFAYDVTTYITHPWEFTDAVTKEHYRVNNKLIFRPPANVGGMMYRTNWNITIGMRTLRDTALLAIVNIIQDSNLVQGLELPQYLKVELARLIEGHKNMKPELS